MRHLFRLSVVLILFVGPWWTLTGQAQVQWLTWEEAQARNLKEPRKFIVDVYTKWCRWCKEMDKATFDQPQISKYINDHYYPIKFDAETREDITFRNKVFKYVRSVNSGYHELANEITFGKFSYPTIVFLDENLNVIQPLSGYRSPSEMDKIMKYFGEDYHKTTPWKKYEMMYLQQHGTLLADPPPARKD
jgi:thioredoxin-related protein